MPKKLNVGFFSFTSDEGCTIVFVEILNYKFFELKELIDFKYVKILKNKNEHSNIDVAFVEGAISSKKEIDRLKKIRENSKKLVAIGSCAINGTPSNHRNFFDEKKFQEISPILKRFNLNKNVEPLEKFVKVDSKVEGCPINEEKFVEVLNSYLKEFGVI